MPRYASLGDEIKLTPHSGKPGKALVGLACNSNDGHWFCVVHQAGFNNQIGAESHYAKHEAECLFVWMCHEHGPEEPV